jgi:ribonuclease HII
MAAKRRQLRGFDLKQMAGFGELLGVDEAGRGALAGPVVAGAVLVTRSFLEGRWAVANAGRVNDSKQLSAAEREALWNDFEKLENAGEIHANFGVADVGEIEALNILGATKLAMRRAIAGIDLPTDFAQQTEPDLFSSAEEIAAYRPRVSCRVLVDGLPLKYFPYPHTAIVNGDARSLCVAMASIVAKVTRDRLMTELSAKFPEYGFAQHKGYGTEEHCAAIRAHGPGREHRGLFLRKLMAGRIDPAQVVFLKE